MPTPNVRLLALAGLASCAKSAAPLENAAPAPEAAPATARMAPVFDPAPTSEGLGFTLRSVDAQEGSAALGAVSPSSPLATADLDKLLARAPALEAPPSDRKAFAVRERSLPPPRTGETVQTGFPSAADLAVPTVEAGPLKVLRRSPEGDVPVAPNFSVTFSQPMIAVATQEQASAHVPVRLSPEVPGAWRWLGTKTLFFQPTGRFPAATTFTATIPEGTASMDGQKLAATTWTFQTPPPAIESTAHGALTATALPRGRSSYALDNGPQPLQPVLGLVFDQKIDPAALLKVVRLTGDAALRLATDAEQDADPIVAAWRKDPDQAGRIFAVTPVAPLPRETSFSLLVPKGAPSAEGPRTTLQDQSISFHTYAPLRLLDTRCDWGSPCPPTSSWSVEFNNPLDAAAIDPATITVSPAVPGFHAVVSGSYLSLSGTFTGRTRYTVRIPGATKDTFGQSLGADATVTLDVGPAERTLVGPNSQFVVADPAGGGKVSFFTTNSKGLKVRVTQVDPEDWAKWVDWNSRYRWEDAKRPALPGRTVRSGIVPVDASADAMVETRVDLGAYLKNGSGNFLVSVEPQEPPPDRWSRQEWIGWVQVTKLGLTAFADRTRMVVWANDLQTGRAVDGATVKLLGTDVAATTDRDGLAALPLRNTQAVVVRRGDDLAMLVNDPNAYGGGWSPEDTGDRAAWYVMDDKHLYKPGETVHVHGWLRKSSVGPKGDVSRLDNMKLPVQWTLTSAMGNPLGSGTTELSELGGFSLDVTLPKTPDLGTATLQLSASTVEVEYPYTTHTLEIQEYRTPEFEVVTDAGDAPHTLGEDATVDVDAHYYAGGALPGAQVTWTATATAATFSPPGREEWSFGPWAPWWWDWNAAQVPTTSKSLAAVTDASGRAHVGLHFDTMKPVRPYSVHVEATVMDVNRQAWTSGQDLLVHPSELYVGLKTARPWSEKGKPIDVQSLVVDRSGAVQTGASVALTLARLEWKSGGRGWTQEEVDPVSCTVTAGTTAQSCTFTPAAGGQYVVRGRVADRYGRPNETELRLWVSGADEAPDRDVAQEKVTLLPEKKAYAPGETATFGVEAPFWPAEGTLTLRRDGLVETKRFRMEGSSTTLSVPITDAYLPDLTVQVDLVGQAKRSSDAGREDGTLAPRVAYASGSLSFDVSTASRALTVAVKPAETELAPAGKTSIVLDVKDAQGRPVSGAELAVVAVDEAVLALTGYQLPDPMSVFYATRGAGVGDAHLRAYVNLTNPTAAAGGLGAQGMGPGGGGVVGGTVGGVLRDEGRMMPMMELAAAPAPSMPADGVEYKKAKEEAPMPAARRASMDKNTEADATTAATTPIAMRTDFRATALWAPDVRTDAAGQAIVPLNLPDSLTRYRIMVVAVSGDRLFGTGQADVTARLPLMVRPSPPRFLNFGDSLELPVVVQNQTAQPLTVDVGVRAANLDVGGDKTGKRVTIPAHDRAEVRFDAKALMAGTARAQFVVASGAYADAATVELPVWTPATSEAFATYGVVDKGAIRQPLATPTDVWPQFGGLTVTTSSTNLQALTDAFLYLVRYPFDCNEQRAARLLGIAGLRDILGAFDAPGVPDDATLQATVAADLQELAKRQNYDGGFAFWRRNDPSWPYLSVEVAHALVRAEKKGYTVDAGMKNRSLAYVRTVEARIPAWYSQEAKWVIRAYGIYVAELAGEPQPAKAKALLREATVDKLPIEAQGYLLPTLGKSKEADQIEAFLANRVAESAAGAHFVTNISDGAQVLLESDRRADGVLLEALIRTDPKSDLIPKLVEGLLAHRKKGAWANTTENASVLLAMDLYFHTYENVTPNFVARAWLGDTYAGDHTFQGRTTERARTDVPMEDLLARKDPDLVLQKDGDGRMYYRIGLDYAPKDLHLDPVDYGFTVVRAYEAVDHPEDVRHDADGTWHVKAGARVRVKLQMVSPMRRYHVALVDPLPAGFEVINPALATSGTLPQEEPTPARGWWWWWRTWYEHENLRDDRVEAFTSLLWEGVYDYSYIARATTLGTFVVPPTKAEEMYTPETFGRAGSDKVVIE